MRPIHLSILDALIFSTDKRKAGQEGASEQSHRFTHKRVLWEIRNSQKCQLWTLLFGIRSKGIDYYGPFFRTFRFFHHLDDNYSVHTTKSIFFSESVSATARSQVAQISSEDSTLDQVSPLPTTGWRRVSTRQRSLMTIWKGLLSSVSICTSLVRSTLLVLELWKMRFFRCLPNEIFCSRSLIESTYTGP